MKDYPKILLLQPHQEESQKVVELVKNSLYQEFPNANLENIDNLQNLGNSISNVLGNRIPLADLVIGNLDGGNIYVILGITTALSKSKPIILIAPLGKAISIPLDLSNLTLLYFNLNQTDKFHHDLRKAARNVLTQQADKNTENISNIAKSKKEQIFLEKTEIYKEKIKKIDPYRLSGSTLNNKYYLDGFIGSGGMGAVYLASVESGEIFAVKILKPDIAIHNEKYLKLFEKEAATAKKLEHPNIVKIFDSGIDSISGQEVSYMVMEWIDGKTLEDILTEKKLELSETKHIFKQICEAVGFAHTNNILHLDIKPQNVLIKSEKDRNYKAKVIDFGLSKIISSESGTTVTQFRGTPRYCSPEHFVGKLTYRSDIYSLGATLYHMLTGVLPFGTSYIIAKQNPNIELPEIPSLKNQNPHLPIELDWVIKKTLSKNPLKRQQSVQSLFLEFEKAIQTSRKHLQQLSINRLKEKNSEKINIPVIKVIGVGGGGGNAINRMIEAGIQGVEFIVANTDTLALNKSNAPIKIQLGRKLTRGLGAGSNPNVGRDAALEDHEKIMDVLEGSDMVFVVYGLGGGTGTGAAPVIASLAIELGALTVAVVTKPFIYEGRKRILQAERGLAELRGCADTIITIPYSRLKEVEEKISIMEAFRRADDALLQAVKSIGELITESGVSLDFRDVKTVMQGMGEGSIGTGQAIGKGAAVKAMRAAIDSMFFEGNFIGIARGILINITGSMDMPLHEIEEALALIHDEAHEDANIIFGIVFEESMLDEVKITVIAIGFDNQNLT